MFSLSYLLIRFLLVIDLLADNFLMKKPIYFLDLSSLLDYELEEWPI